MLDTQRKVKLKKERKKERKMVQPSCINHEVKSLPSSEATQSERYATRMKYSKISYNILIEKNTGTRSLGRFSV